MNYAATISARLGVDAKPFSTGMAQAGRDGESAGNRIAKSTNRASDAHRNLIKSASGAGTQLGYLARDMMAGADAATLLGNAMTAVGHSLRVGMGWVAGLLAGGMGILQIVEARKEWSKLNDELDRAAKPRDASSTKPIEEDIKERREAIAKADKAKEEKKNNPWPTGTNWIWKSSEAITEGLDKVFNPVPDIIAAHFKKQYDSTWSDAMKSGGGAKDKTWSDAMKSDGGAKDKSWSDALRPNKSGDEIRGEKTKAAKAQTDAIEAEKKAAEKTKDAAERQQKTKEGMQLSLSDLAKNGREWAPGNDTRAGAGRMAREAIKEQELSRRDMLAENYGGALMHRDRAEEIKNGIPGLKDSDKDMASAVQRGNDSSAIFRSMLEAMQGRMVNR